MVPEWKSHYDWVYGKRPKYELYDLKQDPHETKNLADDPAHADLKKNLEKRLLEELRRTGDPRMVNDGQYFEKAPLSGPLPEQAAGGKKGKKPKKAAK
jgi:arylsulfatase A-like enzyme